MSSKFRFEILAALLLVLTTALLMYLGATHILDTKLYYSHEVAMAYFNALGSSGTENYKLIALVDLFAYIPAYTWLLFLVSKRFLTEKYLLFSFVPAAFDILETSTIYLYLAQYKESFPEWMGIITWLKWSSGSLLVALLCIKFIRRTFRSV